MATILGIETSCDETAAAVVRDGREVLSNVVAGQFDLHAKYGGVVPEIASRAHIERIDAVIAEALTRAFELPDPFAARNCLDAVAVTHRPGLIGSLLVGVAAAKTLAWAWDKPLVGVNHVEAHAASAAIELDRDPWPAVALIVSGGHTSLYHVRDLCRMERLGRTLDDAAGEAFDKVAATLGLGFPGGPAVERAAADGDPDAVDFPRSKLGDATLDFSFSGLKTAVLYHVHGPGRTRGGLDRLTPRQIAEVAASFQAAVVDVLVAKTLRAAERTGVGTIVGGGGVTANRALRDALQRECRRGGLALHLPAMRYCTDNAAMVAAAAESLLAAGRTAPLSLPVMST